LNAKSDGAVPPILHVKGFTIANPTISGTMSWEELTALFSGYGYSAHIVDLSDSIDDAMNEIVIGAYGESRDTQLAARTGKVPERPRWPMVILRTPKGWTGSKVVDANVIEGSFRAHQVSTKDAKTNPVHLEVVANRLRP
jgi:xylulose-5-phosphate/fructose-6-phosphate phosphoketolase